MKIVPISLKNFQSFNTDGYILVKHFNVLLVEDHRVIQKVMTMLLTSIACKVDVAMTGSVALDIFQKNDFDLILLDIGLPDLDGLSIAKAMRESTDNQKANTPIIILTAHADNTFNSIFRSQANSIGINDFLVKPCTLEMCKAMVTKYASLKKQP